MIWHVTRSRDHCPCHPDVAVTWHGDEPMPERLAGLAVLATHKPECDGCYVPPEITEARKRLPKHRPTDRDYFAEARRG